MDHDEHEHDGHDGHEHVHAQVVTARLRWTDVVLWFTAAGHGLGSTLAGVSSLIAQDVVAHRNYVASREHFAASASEQIESITADDSGATR